LAIADGTRRQILAMVWRRERTAGEIAAEFTMTRPAVSQHLAILRERPPAAPTLTAT
jgi:DNA-binding transcriptional ArsR family regulator